MDLSKILEQLRWELEHLDRAIKSLECLRQSSSELRSAGSPSTESQRSPAQAEKVRPVAIRKVSGKTE